MIAKHAKRKAVSKQPETLAVPVEGMTCAACVSRVEKAVAKAPGVVKVEVSLPRHVAHVTLAAPAQDLRAVLEAILDAGYEPAASAQQILAKRTASAAAAAAAAERTRLTRSAVLAVAIASTQMLVMLAFGHASHLVLLVSTVPVVWVARSFFVRAWSATRHGTADMNTLIALGSGTAIAASTVATFAPRVLNGEVHFEAASFILGFVLVGRALEARARARTTAALDALLALVPAVVTLVKDGVEMRVAAAEVRPGDEVALRPGDRVPVDGAILTGTSRLDESTLTGESRAIAKKPGDEVHAGTLVVDGALRVRATRTGDDTQLARITALVEHAQGTRAPVQRLADRAAAVFAPVIVVIALGSALAWALLGPEPRAVNAVATFVAVVVVSCPCALGLATPTALATAVGRAAELGVLMRSGEALERAAEVDTVALDKTGTLTTGEPALASFDAKDDAKDDDALRLAAAAERGSEHAVGRAILEAARARGLDVPEATDFEATAGAGVRATVQSHDVKVGRLAWLGAEGNASFGVMVDGALVATGTVADALRPEAKDVVARLRALGLRIVVLTGDRDDVARAVCTQLGIDEVHAELHPQDKLAKLDALAKAGRKVAMCGDGVNDAPSLARAHVGVSLSSGTDAAVDASDVTLLSGGLGHLPDALGIARRTMHVVRQNLGWAFVYNIILVPVAAGALVPSFGIRMPPVLASVAMALSSVSVVLSSLRLRRFGQER
jgi:Cu+-exporting ATPase